jgi:hypothetical protein
MTRIAACLVESYCKKYNNMHPNPKLWKKGSSRNPKKDKYFSSATPVDKTFLLQK